MREDARHVVIRRRWRCHVKLVENKCSSGVRDDARHVLKSIHSQTVTHATYDGDDAHDMVGRLASAKIVVIHARQVVVDE